MILIVTEVGGCRVVDISRKKVYVEKLGAMTCGVEDLK